MTSLAAAQVTTVVIAAMLAAIVASDVLRGRVAVSTGTGLVLVLIGVLIGDLRLVPTWVVRDAWLIGFPAVLATYPDGQFVPSWTRPVLAATVVVALADAAGQGWLLERVVPFLLGPITIVFLPCQVYRYRRRSTVDERTRVRWPILFVGWTMVGYGALGVLSDEPAGTGTGWSAAVAAGLGLLPQVGLVIGLVRPQLADIDRILRESVRWLSLAAVTIGAYLAAGVIATATGWQSVADEAAAAAAVIAALGARRAAALLADRFVGAAKPDPVRILTVLGERYEQSLDGDQLAGSIARTIAHALLLSDVEVTIAGLEAGSVRPAMGPAASSRSERFGVVYQGEQVGVIRVGPRAAELEVSSRDRTLLRLLATHAGPAMHAVRVVADLRRAREHLVLAREEERRRLRRDLHDDLAPQLAGLALSGAAVRQFVTTDPARAIDLAGQLADDLRRASQQVREIAYDLRPPVLDDLGLTAAVVDRVARPPDGGGPNVVVDAPENRLELPAAVELAALRIVQEAVTNTRKHARASECRVVLHLDGRDLLVQITDDGRGFRANVRKGVGLRSMAERAAELGGTCDVRSSPGGTSVLVRLPVAMEAGT
jgi:signal transduction histidine kinase